MHHKHIISTLIIYSLLSGCAGSNLITQEEIAKQNKADATVAGILFERELDTSASYNTRNDGFVVIKFDESVSRHTYTEVVNVLRSRPEITGVRAEQSGIEVCPLQ
jgi:hypothetical protein